MSAARISVVMSVRDGASFLADAIDSVLGQTRPPDEVIVVDDGSNDATPAILARYAGRLRVERRPPIGYAAALNHGLSRASGDLVAFQDADDLWMPRKLELQLAALGERSDVDAVGGHVEQFLTIGAATSGRRFTFDPGPLPGVTLPCLLLRRSLVEQSGPLDEAFGTAAALDWIARISGSTEVLVLAEVVLRRRIHGENVSVTAREHRDRALLRVLRHHRRRNRPNAPR